MTSTPCAPRLPLALALCLAGCRITPLIAPPAGPPPGETPESRVARWTPSGDPEARSVRWLELAMTAADEATRACSAYSAEVLVSIADGAPPEPLPACSDDADAALLVTIAESAITAALHALDGDAEAEAGVYRFVSHMGDSIAWVDGALGELDDATVGPFFGACTPGAEPRAPSPGRAVLEAQRRVLARCPEDARQRVAGVVARGLVPTSACADGVDALAVRAGTHAALLELTSRCGPRSGAMGAADAGVPPTQP